MPWYDGTQTISNFEFEEWFPIKITSNLFLDETGKHMAIVNTFVDDAKKSQTKVSRYYKASVPPCDPFEPFYHVFPSEDAKIVKESILKHHRETRKLSKKQSYVGLYIRNYCGEEGYTSYSALGGFIRLDLMKDQEALKKTLEKKNIEVEDGAFILPLERYFEYCECCGNRSIYDPSLYCECCGYAWYEDFLEDFDVIEIGDITTKMVDSHILKNVDYNKVYKRAFKRARKLARKKHVHTRKDIKRKSGKRK